MNWYKYKIAFPIQEKKNPFSTYEDYRHEGDDPDYTQKDIDLWFIDTNFNFYITPVTKEIQTHWGWDEFKNAHSNKKALYHGRYDHNKHEASLTRVQWFYIDPLFKRLYQDREDIILEKAEKILDKKLNNPTILVF